MYAMPRRTFRSTATALLAIPQTSSGSRTPRSASPLPVSMSMTLPATPHAPHPSPSCHSSPGNAIDDDANRSIVDFPLPPTAPRVLPDTLPPSPAAFGRRDWKRLLKSKQRYTLLRKAVGLLHDNRALSSKHPDTARRLRQLNAELRADKSHRVLKFILNALFLAVGLLLLLSVLAAIAYTSTVPHDTKDDVVEQFLSKILPGSGTVYRSDWHQPISSKAPVDGPTTSATAVGSTPPTVTRQAAKTAAVKRKVCKMVAIDSRDENNLQMKRICFHISDATPNDPEMETQLKISAK